MEGNYGYKEPGIFGLLVNKVYAKTQMRLLQMRPSWGRKARAQRVALGTFTVLSLRPLPASIPTLRLSTEVSKAEHSSLSCHFTGLTSRIPGGESLEAFLPEF